MRSVVLVKSCLADCHNGVQTAVRHTWMQQWGHLVPHYFVHGVASEWVLPGEIHVAAGDTWDELWQKTLGGIRWAHTNGYDFLFNCCTDTYVHVPRLLASGYEEHDYVGHRLSEGHASGGAGFWLSRRAMEACMEQPWSDPQFEDLQVFRLLQNSGIVLHHEPRYAQQVEDDAITVHLSPATGVRPPELLYACHDRLSLH